MKKLILAAFTLMVLAGTTLTVPNFSNSTVLTAATTKKTTPQPASIPPPTCPPNDPNGCGIFG